ncbi:MAG: lysine--tRNA ligase [Gemmatimonadales bacterium]|jgi:lysyl-tRNA synthetase class 2
MDPGLRDGLPIREWYASDDRPKPVRDRYAKLQKLREIGVDPYAYSFAPTHELAAALASFDDEEPPERVRVAGRLVSIRDMGRSAFAHLGDRTGRLQVYFKKNEITERDAALVELLDLGDWVGVEGELFRTRTGEVTVRVESLQLLSKSLRPLPLGKTEVLEDGTEVVHSGFADVEMRYRQRYADLAVNAEVREVFVKRSRIIRALRRVLDEEDYLEVETPILQPMYGGAFARPFTTHHNTLDRTMYLRIADELYLKRLLVGTLDRVYEIGKDFRNEGLDRTHNPEFTMLEAYLAYADYEAMMDLAERLVLAAAEEVCEGYELEWNGLSIDLAVPWERISFFEAIEREAGIDARAASDDELRSVLGERVEDAAGLRRAQLLDEMFGAFAEPALVDPTIVFDYPIEMSPLAKPKRGDAGLAERFEVIVGGTELVNAFSELNDPIDQWERFADQARARAAGDEEAPDIDADYVRALEYGLPPTGGLGLGVDRLVMLLTGQSAIRDVLLYPVLRDVD